MNTMKWHPRGYGGQRRAPEQVKRDGWREQGVLAVAIDDERLTWPSGSSFASWATSSTANVRRRLMAEWNRDMVEERVEEAADVLRHLPPVRLSGYFSTWPDILRSFGDRVGANPVPMRRPPPNPSAISRMEETITWNRFLERDEVHLMWARAEGTPWKHLCYRFGISRPTAHRRYDYALSVIAWRLNGRQVHHRRGRKFVVARARGR